jgi:hypothetical protein
MSIENQNIIPPTNSNYEISRITLNTEPDITNVATSKINQNINTQKLGTITGVLGSTIPFEVKITNVINNKKGEIQSKLIPFVVQQLTPFGSEAVQFILNNKELLDPKTDPSTLAPLLVQLKQYVNCPNQNALLQLIRKRNNLANQINKMYNTVNILNKTLSTTNTIITAAQVGIAVIKAIPYPATGIPPIGLPPLTTGIIEITGEVVSNLSTLLKRSGMVVNALTLASATFGVLLGSVLSLLNILDTLIQQCSQDQNVPFTTINNELNLLVNQSTGVSNSTVIAVDKTYKGFTLEIKLDETNTTQYKKRYAQALSKQGVPVLRTESSFASDPQVLVDQLKFIIDSNPNLTAE